MRARWCVLAAAALLAACGRESPPPSRSVAPARPPLVLISIDTLRSDHLPAYGYRGVATPAIDALRRDAVLFERAYAEVPLTVPSHVALLTGVPPWESGVRDNTATRFDAATLPYLPAQLARLGYRTGGAVSVYLLERRAGFAVGFERYEDAVNGPQRAVTAGAERAGLETFAAARDWLAAVAAEPFFLFLHVYEPHAPHQPPAPFPPTYDGDVAAADRAVGALLDELRRLGVYDRAAIVLLSDHGEGLGDHGEDEHGLLLYRESLQVPLLLKLPRGERAGSSVALPVQLLDVAPTLLGIAGGTPDPRQRGRSLRELDPTPRTLLAETLYPRLHFGWSDLASAIEGDLHYVDGPRPELYDLRVDPGETRDLLGERRRDAARLRAATAGVDRTARPTPVDDETRRALASLGYLSGGAAVGKGPLPNPRDRVATLATLRAGVAAWARGDFAGAARELERAVRENPGVLDGWEFLARSAQGLGNFDRCVEAYSEILARSDHAPQAAVGAAQCLLQKGRAGEALAVLRGESRRSPRELEPQLFAAQVELRLGDVAAARRTVAGLLAERPDLPDAIYLRGAIAMGGGDRAGAERDLRRVLELDPAHVAAMSDLAILLDAQGRTPEARALLRRVVELHPEDAAARRNLAAMGGS